MIIRISLVLVIASVLMYIVADFSVWLDMQNLTNGLAWLGSTVLLSAFALLFVTGLLAVGSAAACSAADYFSLRQRLGRRLLYIQNQQNRLQRLFYFKAMQLHYFNEIKTKRLLAGNNRKHLRSLSQSIQNDLRALKKNIPATTYKQLQRENKTCYRRQDAHALLRLQQKIADLV